jgi:tetratricopeptide (TPR) repeat protein
MKFFGKFRGNLAQKKLTDELNEYYAFAEQNPDDIRVHLRIADVLMKLDQKYKAIEEYIHAAQSYESSNLPQIAAAIYKQILHIDPEQINVYNFLADLYCRVGIVGDAIATYEKLARYFYDHGSTEDAMKTLEKMVSLDPKSVYVKKKIAKFYSEKKIDSPSGQAHYVNWELSDPVTSGEKQAEPKVTHAEGTFFDLGSALEDDLMVDEETLQSIEGVEGDIQASIPGFDEIFEEIKKDDSKQDDLQNSLFHYNLGTALQKTKRYDEAIDELIKAAEDSKRTLDCYLRLAVCFREKDMFNDAISYLKKGLTSKGLPSDKELAFNYEMAVTYKKQGKARKAQKIFKKISKTDSDFREVKRELAEQSS